MRKVLTLEEITETLKYGLTDERVVKEEYTKLKERVSEFIGGIVRSGNEALMMFVAEEIQKENARLEEWIEKNKVFMKKGNP